jgi:hypothetical protein
MLYEMCNLNSYRSVKLNVNVSFINVYIIMYIIV